MAELNRELADFLRRARADVDPARAGLPADGYTIVMGTVGTERGRATGPGPMR